MHESVGWLRLQLYFEGMSQRAALKMLRTIQVDNKSGRTSAGPCSHYRAARAGSEAQNRYTGEKASKDEGGLQASLSRPLKADEDSSGLLLGKRQNKREWDTCSMKQPGKSSNCAQDAFDVQVCFAGLYKPIAIHHNGRAATYFNRTCVSTHKKAPWFGIDSGGSDLSLAKHTPESQCMI